MLNYQFKNFDASKLYRKGKKGEYVYDNAQSKDIVKNLKLITGELCSVCCRKYSPSNKCTIEHIITRNDNQSLCNVSNNLILICDECNRKRSNISGVFDLYKFDGIFDQYYVGIDGEIILKSNCCDKCLMKLSIDAYDLNDPYLKERRKMTLKEIESKELSKYYYNIIMDNNLDEVEFPFILASKLDENQVSIVLDKYKKRWD